MKWIHSDLPIMEFWYLWDSSIHRIPEDFADKRNLIMKNNLEALVKNLSCFNDIVFSAGIKHNTEEEALDNIEKHRKNMI